METDASTNYTADASTMDGASVTANSAAALDAELTATKAKAEENYNKFLYAMADFENYKKRVERQLSEISLSSKRSIIAKFLPVIDNLERALAHQNDADGVRGGLQATLRGFEAILAGEGVKPIAVKGTPFDPRVAEAIGTMPSPGLADDMVVEEAERGYVMGEDLLRPAKVLVVRNNA